LAGICEWEQVDFPGGGISRTRGDEAFVFSGELRRTTSIARQAGVALLRIGTISACIAGGATH